MKNSRVETQSVHPYKGHWTDEGFVVDDKLLRKDLTDPAIKPSFIVSLTNGERILVGWTDKAAHRMFFIKEIEPKPGTADRYKLKVIRMRGEMWRKTIKAVKKGMTRWFAGENFYGINAFGQFSMPLIRRVYPQLIANDLVGVQPMTSPTSLIFQMKYGQKTNS